MPCNESEKKRKYERNQRGTENFVSLVLTSFGSKKREVGKYLSSLPFVSFYRFQHKLKVALTKFQPIAAISHFPPCLFSLIYSTTSKALARSCMVELQPLKRNIFDAVSSMNTSLWFNDVLVKGTWSQNTRYRSY